MPLMAERRSANNVRSDIQDKAEEAYAALLTLLLESYDKRKSGQVGVRVALKQGVPSIITEIQETRRG